MPRGTVRSGLRRYEDARHWLELALEVRRGLVAKLSVDEPHQAELAERQRKLANILMNLGVVDQRTGKLDAALGRIEEAQTLRSEIMRHSEDTRWDWAQGSFNLAEIYVALRDCAAERDDDAAFAEYHRRTLEELSGAIEYFTQLPKANPRALSSQYNAALCYRRKGDALNRVAEAEAEQMYREAVELMEPLARGNPDVHEYAGRLAGIYLQIGVLYSGRNDEAALKALEDALGILTSLVQEYRDVPDYRADLALTQREIGRDRLQHEAFDEAADHLVHSKEQFLILLADHELAAALEPEFVEAVALLVKVYLQRGEREKAVACVQDALRAVPENEDLQKLLKELQDGDRKR